VTRFVRAQKIWEGSRGRGRSKRVGARFTGIFPRINIEEEIVPVTPSEEESDGKAPITKRKEDGKGEDETPLPLLGGDRRGSSGVTKKGRPTYLNENKGEKNKARKYVTRATERGCRGNPRATQKRIHGSFQSKSSPYEKGKRQGSASKRKLAIS